MTFLEDWWNNGIVNHTSSEAFYFHFIFSLFIFCDFRVTWKRCKPDLLSNNLMLPLTTPFIDAMFIITATPPIFLSNWVSLWNFGLTDALVYFKFNSTLKPT